MGKATGKEKAELPVLGFQTPKDLAAWLNKHGKTSPGIWLKLAKKGSGQKLVTYAEAVESALCYGWIDGQARRFDDAAWLVRFTPRGPKSIWSKINRTKALALIESGRMKPAGLKAIESARQDGRWDAAYDSQSIIDVPADFQAGLDSHPKAKAFFATVSRANRFAFLFRIQMAKKPETRAKRIRQFIEMLAKHETIH